MVTSPTSRPIGRASRGRRWAETSRGGAGRFDIAFSGLIYGHEPDIAADWSCFARPPLGGNFSRWCDPVFESAAAKGDRAGMLRRLYDTMACLPLSRAYEDIGIATRVGGFTAPEPLTPATYGCTRWSLNA